VFRSLPGGGNAVVATNDNWGDNADVSRLSAVTQDVFAFPLTPGSADAATMLALNPGAYTIVISGADGGTGLALMEVYLVAP
jgi:hypothetical protein